MPRFSNNKKFVIKSHDVFLVSYPRSGNTWLRYLLGNLLYPTLEWNIENLNLVIPDLHQEIPANYLGPQPRLFKSHFPYRQEYPRVIYLCRDGRDVSVSYYDLRNKKGLYKKEYPEFLLEMLQGKMPYGSWQDHVNSWVFHSHQTPLLPIKYEQLCEDTPGTLQLLGDFLGFKWSDREIELAISKSTFEKQKKDFYIYKYESHWAKGFRGGVKGAPGKWREVFTDELNQVFWEYAGNICEKLGYPKY